ncbi:hypothetical protein ACG0Z5_17480 [Scandinavium sp. M-37]|uniref:hypothetical protein n=1 Tax=Scandinavium sp. M-37 TaxID=3373077 RepID=UPI003746C95F
MNWAYLHHSRAALIRLLTETEDNEHLRFETLRYALRDNVLLSVVRITTKDETSTSGAGATVTLLQCYVLCQAEKKMGIQGDERKRWSFTLYLPAVLSASGTGTFCCLA